MNKIYALKYSNISNSLIAVSELSTKCIRKLTNNYIFIFIGVIFSLNLKAGTVNNAIEYQTFLDFAENKGMFRPGEKNIAIYNKQGELVGTLDKAAMPDFSST
ncbi:hypothetical protein NGH75_24060, partial [Escherichia coli]|nr:hypothetical protein [Escherichia coli]